MGNFPVFTDTDICEELCLFFIKTSPSVYLVNLSENEYFPSIEFWEANISILQGCKFPHHQPMF